MLEKSERAPGTHCLGDFKVKNVIALTTMACIISFRAIDELQREDSIIHMPQCLPGMEKRANNFCKRRAECFHRFLVIASMEHGQWQASFTPEKSTDKNEVSVTE